MDSPHRPLAFNKMEALVQEMQDIENGVPVRSQKLFLTSIPSAFMGYDLIEWLMEHLDIEESVEAVHIANQLCQYGYFFPISDSRNLVVKDDSSLYRFQIPYYWPWQHRSPDNMEYAIYLAKRSLRNKQRHALEDYECDALSSLRKNLSSKWDAITMHAEEQVRLAKDRKKGEKIVADSQERAYWRVHRPPPGYTSLLEPVPICRGRGGTSSRSRRSSIELQREVQYLKSCLNRTRQKTSVALESLVQHCELYHDYDPFISGAQPCNPWHLQPSEEPAFWLYNSSLVEVPTEKRVKKWSLSMEDLVCDETGLQEFTSYLKKEYNHENIKFWTAVKDLRGSSQSHIPQIVKQIYNEFLAAGAPCEINIDGKTMEKTLDEMKNPSRFTFDAAAEHVYTLLLKKDCYPRFIRSDHYKTVLSSAIQPSTKKRFFGFGGPAKKKGSSTVTTTLAGLSTTTISGMTTMSSMSAGQDQIGFGPCSMTMSSRRRGSDRSSTGSTTELIVAGIGTGAITVTGAVKSSVVPNSHSQSNLSEVPYSDAGGVGAVDASIVGEKRKSVSDNTCPWDVTGPSQSVSAVQLHSTYKSEDHSCQWESSNLMRKHSTQLDVDSGSSSSDVSLLATGDLSDRQQRPCPLAQGHVPANTTRLRRFSSTTTTTGNPPIRGVTALITSQPSISSSSAEDIIAACTHHKSSDSNIFRSDKINVQVECETERIPVLLEQDQKEIDEQQLRQEKSEQKQFRPKLQSQQPETQQASKQASSGNVSVSSTSDQKYENEENIPIRSSSKSKDLREKFLTGSNPSPSCSNLTSSHFEHPTGSRKFPSISVKPATTEDDSEGRKEVSEADVKPRLTEQQSEEGKTQQPQSEKKSKDDLEKSDSNVCPWEDEDSCKVDTPFVKTYATLGYL